MMINITNVQQHIVKHVWNIFLTTAINLKFKKIIFAFCLEARDKIAIYFKYKPIYILGYP